MNMKEFMREWEKSAGYYGRLKKNGESLRIIYISDTNGIVASEFRVVDLAKGTLRFYQGEDVVAALSVKRIKKVG